MSPPVQLITPISSPPVYISRAEHNERTRATPASFADIPPVLVHKEDNVSVELDPPLEGLSEEELKKGTLFIVESILAFITSTGSGRGFEIKYPHITLHAISRGSATSNQSCIYCQLDDVSEDDDAGAGFGLPSSSTTNGHGIDTNSGSENGEDDGDDDDDAENEIEPPHSTLRELKIIPQTEASLEPIFEALSHCASLHSDTGGVPDSDDDMGEDDAFVDADIDGLGEGDDAQELSEVGRAALEYLESIIEYPHDKPRPDTKRAEGVDKKVLGDKEHTKSDAEGNNS